MKKICVVGTGYVGLVTGACFADLGNQVVCLDIVAEKIEQLRAGVLPIYEPGLDSLVERNARAGRLSFTTSYADAVSGAHFIFISVNTPTKAGGAGADMSFVEAAARSIATHLDADVIIVNKSTMPVGSGDLVSTIVHEHLADSTLHIAVVSNPEFLSEGFAVRDFQHPDRVVLGSADRSAAERVAELYLPLRAPIVITDLYTAEMIKYASNAFLATKISFINEIARICDRLGADVKEVAAGMGYDKRIGSQFLYAGLGYGGSCFEADETVFALNSPNVAAQTFDTMFEKGVTQSASSTPFQGDVVELVTPRDQRVLAFDLDTGQPTLAQVKAITRRPYKGRMVTIRTQMGRVLRVTADHPVVLEDNHKFAVVPAAKVTPGDKLMALCELPAVQQATALNLLELLRGTDLENDVYVRPDDDSFTRNYKRFCHSIPAEMLAYPNEIERHNRMSLRLFRYLNEAGVLDVPAAKLSLYTAKGAATTIPALIPIDADLLRFCGYYLAEGCIALDTGRAGAVRERVQLSFNKDEDEYIADVKRILTRWGMKYIQRRSPGALTTVVSSRIFAWLLRDVLCCGVCSKDKSLPRLVFNVSTELREQLIKGAFSGDGTVTTAQQGKNFILEYATVSKPLADGMALLLQSNGIVPSALRRMMKKSKRPAYILRVSGYAQLAQLADIFGDKRREKILNLLAGYRRHIRQWGFERRGPFATLAVRKVEFADVETTVYSMETTTGTLIASSGIISHNCFPKDVKALAHMADEAGLHPQLLDAVMKINQDQRRVAIEKLEAHFGGLHSLKEKTIAVLGLAFKDNTDDMREAPSIDVIDWLIEAGATVKVFDPVAVETAQKVKPNWEVAYCENEYEAAEGADGVVLVTEWKRFQELDLERLFAAMNRDANEPVFIDGRNLLDPDRVERAGFRYHGIGRGKVARKNGTPDAGVNLQAPSAVGTPFAVRGDR